MATTQQINDFKATLMWEETRIGSILNNLLAINGRSENKNSELKFKLINIYTNIMIDYFNEPNYSTYNFFDIDQMYKIIEHFNDLCKTNYTITL
jgi:hypothetical protein